MNLFLASSINFVAQDVARQVFQLTKNHKLLFISTAAEGEEGDKSWLSEDREKLVRAGFDISDYSITGQNESAIEEKLAKVGSICVSGGDTYYLLDQARKSGFDNVIEKHVQKGLIYIGASAGSMLAGSDISTSLDNPVNTANLTDYTGLGLTDVAICPHWGSEHMRERYHQEINRLYSHKQKIVLLNDQQYLYVKDDWYQIITVPIHLTP